MEKLQKLMNAIIEQNANKNKSESFYLNTIKTNVDEILHVSDDSSCTDNYVFAFKSLLAAAFMNGITADQLFHLATIHTPIENNEVIPSKLNFDYDQKLFEASCAALTGLLANKGGDILNERPIADQAVWHAISLISAVNKQI